MSLVFCDCETSGRDKNVHDVIQIAAIAVDSDLNEIDRFSELFRFNLKKAEPEALAINGFDFDTWKASALLPAQGAAKFYHFIKKHSNLTRISAKGSSYKVARIAGHNINEFDLPFIRAWMARNGQSWVNFDPYSLDTYQLARWLDFLKRGQGLDYAANLRQETLCNYYGMDIEQTHDALDDILENIELYKFLIKELKELDYSSFLFD